MHVSKNIRIQYVGFEVRTAVIMKSSVFSNITPCSPLEFATCFLAGFLLGLFLDPENGSDMFLRNVAWLSMDYTTLYPRRQNTSYSFRFYNTTKLGLAFQSLPLSHYFYYLSTKKSF
jgi:hypothetical protein